MVLSQSGSEGHVDKNEVEMIERVFDLDDTTVREVMVPRPDVVSAAGDLTLPELRNLVIEAGHTRYPVLDAEYPDQVVATSTSRTCTRTRATNSSVASSGPRR